MSVRVLHAADLHLDSPFEALPGEKAARRRQEQRGLLCSLPETARQYGAEIILLPGDLLDSDSQMVPNCSPGAGEARVQGRMWRRPPAGEGRIRRRPAPSP